MRYIAGYAIIKPDAMRLRPEPVSSMLSLTRSAAPRDANHLPKLVHANQRHRRLARRAGPEVHHVYQHALDQISDWFHTGHPELRRRWTQPLDRLGDDPYLDLYHPSRDRIEFATYPETSCSPASSPRPTGGSAPTATRKPPGRSAAGRASGTDPRSSRK